MKNDTVSREEYETVRDIAKAIALAATSGDLGVIPALLDNDKRVVALVVDPHDGRGTIPLAVVIDTDLFNRLTPMNPVLEGSEDVA